MDFTIDLEQFSNMSAERRIAFLESALIFDAIPENNRQFALDYIAKSTAYINDMRQEKSVVVQGGIHRLSSVIKENFPNVLRLKNTLYPSKVEDFANTHQISNDDFVACGGMASDGSDFHFICFRNVSDAVLAKLHFDGDLFKSSDDLAQIEEEASKRADSGEAYASATKGSSYRDPFKSNVIRKQGVASSSKA